VNDVILVKELSKDGNISTSLFKIIENDITKYLVINFEGFRVTSEMQICDETYNKLIKG